MPSFVLSFALLLLVLLTLLAVSNRELIALTFLGVSTVALPLSIWILGAIAAGFLMGLWILLLFRFGTAGVGSGGPQREQRRANYGPEDFAVVDERFAQGESAPVYRDGRYDDNRYDDVYGQDDAGSQAGSGAQGPDRYGAKDYAAGDYAAEDYAAEDYGDGKRPFSAAGYGADYDRGGDRYDAADYADYGDSAYGGDGIDEPQDSFSASSGYDAAEGREPPFVAQSSSATDDVATPERNRSTPSQPASPATADLDPATPEDWNDPYREDWTQEELVAEPVLREPGAAPKLKRWLSPNDEERPRLNLGGFGLGGLKPKQNANASDVDAGGQPADRDNLGDPSDWQATGGAGDRPSADFSRYAARKEGASPASSRDVYDADYRVIRPSSAQAGAAPPEPGPGFESPQSPTGSSTRDPKPQSETEASDDSSRKPQKDDWDIDSDLGW